MIGRSGGVAQAPRVPGALFDPSPSQKTWTGVKQTAGENVGVTFTMWRTACTGGATKAVYP